MGANNWAECPRCRALALIRQEKMQINASQAYGKKPEKEYALLKKLAETPIEIGTTLREDYHLGIQACGFFTVKYECSCRVCGFNYRFETDCEVEIGTDKENESMVKIEDIGPIGRK